MTTLTEMKSWIAKGCPISETPADYDDMKYATRKGGMFGASAYTDAELAAMRQFETIRAEAYAERVAGTPEKREEAMRQISKSLSTK